MLNIETVYFHVFGKLHLETILFSCNFAKKSYISPISFFIPILHEIQVFSGKVIFHSQTLFGNYIPSQLDHIILLRRKI